MTVLLFQSSPVKAFVMSEYFRRRRYPSEMRSIFERATEIEDELLFLKIKRDLEAEAANENKSTNVFKSDLPSMGMGRIPLGKIGKRSPTKDKDAIAARRNSLFDALNRSLAVTPRKP